MNAPVPPEAVALALEVFTIVGSILSIVGLVLTILTMLIFKYAHGILLSLLI